MTDSDDSFHSASEGEGDEDADAAKIAADALKNAEPKKTQTAIANTSTGDQTLLERYAKAFSTDKDGGIELVKSSRR